jgi:uncharacterized protein (TIGR02118 family)
VITVSVLYPGGEGITFDMDYYLNSHMALVQQACGDALKGATVVQGMNGGAPGVPAPYVAMTQLTFDSVEAFGAAMGPKAGELAADVANFTNSTPAMQVSELKLGA